MKIDLVNVRIEDIEGNEATVSVAQIVGNTLYMQGRTVDECELGKRIFHSDGPLEVSEQEAEMVRRVAVMLPHVTRTAVLKQLNV